MSILYLCEVVAKNLKKDWGDNLGSWTHIISTLDI